MVGIELIMTPEPHRMPYYTGYVTGLAFEFGETPGHMTHKLMKAAGMEIKSTAAPDPVLQARPGLRDIMNVTRRAATGAVRKYRHPMVPGYTGWVPSAIFVAGQRFSTAATEGVSAECDREVIREKVRSRPAQNAVVLPLSAVPEDAAAVFRRPKGDDEDEDPFRARLGESPYFSPVGHPDKIFMKGYTGHVPCSHMRFGETSEDSTRRGLDEFTRNYNKNKSFQYQPVAVTVSKDSVATAARQAARDSGKQIFRKGGAVPLYVGHRPGVEFRYGLTFGRDLPLAGEWLAVTRAAA